MDRFTKRVVSAMISYAVIITTVIILFKTVFMLSIIPSGSMENTIMTGDVVISTRYDVKKEEDIKRYDILIFNPPDDPSVTYIKRVIGLPGDVVEVKEGSVYVNGVETEDSFVKSPMNRRGDGTYVVPEGCYFFMGDNRNNSRDSRFWDEKYVPLENILARARFVILPFSNCQAF